MERVAGTLGVAGLIQELNGSSRPKVLPILQHPNDLFLRCDLDQLRSLVVATARAYDGISIGELGDRLGISVPESRRDVGLS
jgi:hypothetical protein